MGRWRTAWTWAQRPLWAALASGVIAVNAVAAQPPTTEPPLAEPPVANWPNTNIPGLPPPIALSPADTGNTGPVLVMPSVTVGTAPPASGSPDSTPMANPTPPCEPCAFDWLNVPPVTPMPRLGYFLIPPAGPGYYSLADLLTGTYRRQAPRQPFGTASLFPPSAFDYDFRYLDDPNNQQTDWSDDFKRIHWGNDWLFSTGGEFRTRYANELNSRGTGINNNYYLLRTRTHADLWYRDQFRVFAEFIYADSFNENLPPLPIDATGPDLLNAFIEVKAACLAGSPLYIRGGRQELLYGSQRLISTLDWANTRRTFQGVKGYWHGENFAVDAFWVQPVVPDPNRFDSVDTNRNFFGVWTTYRQRPGTFFDLYYLGLTTANAPGSGDVQTFGSRLAGDIDGRWLYDAEGAVQFGERAGRNIFAQMATAGLGYRFADLPWNPQLWAYYDYASGTKDPTGPSDRTFSQLFPFGHYYLGYLDLVGRQNIRDLNFQFSYQPQPWITSVVQYHIFRLDARRDALYNAGGVPIRRDPTGLAGDNVGEEIDFATNFHLTAHQDLLVGYSKLFAGDFWRRTGPGSNPELYYVQYSLRW